MTHSPIYCVTFVVLFATRALWADPTLTVTDLGLNGASNREWLVEVAPDPSLFLGGMGSLGLEMAFEVTGSDLVGAVINSTFWPYNNPGMNPFTGTITFGVTTDLSADTVFAALGSDPFSDGSHVEVLTIETFGSGATTLSWDGLIAQAGMIFDGYQGMLSSGGGGVTGDFNNDGLWNCMDINVLSQAIASGSTNLAFDMNGDGTITVADINDPTAGWLTVGGSHNPAATGGRPFLNGDANLSGSVDGSDFGVWNTGKFSSNSNWCEGDFNASGGIDGSDFGIWNGNKFRSSDSLSVIPEPNSLASAAILFVLTLARRGKSSAPGRAVTNGLIGRGTGW